MERCSERTKMHKHLIRRTMAFLLMLSFLLALLPVFPASVSRADGNPNPDTVTLYCITEEAAEVLGELTEDQPQTYQILTTGWEGDVRYTITSGNSVKISASGLLEPRNTVWYWKNGRGTTAYMENPDYIETRYYPGTAVIRVTCGDHSQVITVNVIELGDQYVNEQIQAIYDSCVADAETDLEKFTAFTAWVGNNTIYSGYYQSWQDMILHGCGDCWASTNTIIKLCEMAGIDARVRIANQDGGAGSGHRNAIAKIGDTYYIGEAGYGSYTKPRGYSVYERPMGISAKVSGNTAAIYQWDGFESEFIVPETYNGKTITEFGYGGATLLHNQEVSTIVLPETVTRINALAFYYSTSLTSVYIPKSVTSVDPDLSLKVGITDIYYEGSRGMWDRITNMSSVTIPEGVTLHFNVVHPSNPDYLPFTDLPRYRDDGTEKWQYEPVRYAYERGLVSGDSDTDGDGRTTVRPNDSITRGAFMLILYRMAGSPAVDTSNNPFKDLRNKYDRDAILWGYQNGLVEGYADGTFGRSKPITRAQVAKILMEYARMNHWDVSGRADLTAFLDAGSLRIGTAKPHWAAEYMSWAVEEGIITGSVRKNDAGEEIGLELNQGGQATRAQVCKMLMAFRTRYNLD